MIGWQHVFGDPVPRSIHGFAAGDAFAVAGNPVARDSLLVEAGRDTAQPDGDDRRPLCRALTRNGGDHAVTAALRIDFQAGENGCDAGRDGSTGHGRTDRGKDKGLTQAFETGSRSGGLGRLAVALCVVAAWLVLTTSIGLMPRDAPVSLKQVMTTTLP